MFVGSFISPYIDENSTQCPDRFLFPDYITMYSENACKWVAALLRSFSSTLNCRFDTNIGSN